MLYLTAFLLSLNNMFKATPVSSPPPHLAQSQVSLVALSSFVIFTIESLQESFLFNGSYIIVRILLEDGAQVRHLYISLHPPLYSIQRILLEPRR